MSFNLFRRWSPEYALNEAYADVKEEGMAGLKRHLTANALKSIESIESIASLSTIVVGSNPTNFLISKMAELEYVVNDVLKGSDTARCMVAFNYEDSVEGTIEIGMVKEEKEWRIDSLKNPRFDKMELTLGEAPEDAQAQ